MLGADVRAGTAPPAQRRPRRFTFGHGNVQRLVSAPLYLLGGLVTTIVARRGRHWVIGCGSGVGEGALVLARELARSHTEITVTWLTGSEREEQAAEAAGLDWVAKTSPAGWLRTAQAEVVVLTHGFGDVCRFTTAGAYVVQLWHGIPLKRIQLDSAVTMRLPGLWTPAPLRRLLATAYRRQTARISLLPAASEVVAGRLRTAFAVAPSVVQVTGDPRDDVLADTDGRDVAADRVLRSALPGLPPGPAILYAPTWRDGAPDPAIPTRAEWAAIVAALDRTGTNLIIRSHPHGSGSYAAGPASSPRVAELGSALVADITPVLPAFDQLVTDYSSIALDFALLGRPVHFLAPDATAYAATRELYDDYRLVAGDYTTTWSQTLTQIEDVTTKTSARTAAEQASRQLADRYHDFPAGGATARVLTVVQAGLAARRAPAPVVKDSPSTPDSAST